MDREWKLNKDLSTYDNVFDPITFDDIILALHCNERIIDESAVKKVTKEIMEMRMEDFNFLIKNNVEEIIKLAKVGREY